jgi:CRP-like cAMP-binding protein
MLRKDAKIELLRRVPLFAGCTKRELASLASSTTLLDVPVNTTLVTEGARDRDLIVIVDGSAEVTRGGKRVGTLRSGDFFGEIALLSGGPRTASVTTSQQATLLVLSERDYWVISEQIPSIQVRTLKALAERLQADAV